MTTSTEGLFLTLEGIDGCGKSTQARRLAAWLEERLPPGGLLWTREPGGWPGGEELRRLLLQGRWDHPWSEVFLFLADRCEHAARALLPHLRSGGWVLCERYHDSTLAYQCHGRGLPEALLDQAWGICGLPRPRRTLLLDLPVPEALRRLRLRGELDRLEAEGEAFLERVRRGYRTLADREPDRFRPVDAQGEPEAVFSRLLEALEGLDLP